MTNASSVLELPLAGEHHHKAVFVGRVAALRTLARSSLCSWRFREWWWLGAYAAARALAPASVVRIARTVVRRGQ